MLLQEKIQAGTDGPLVVPPRELPKLAQLKSKTSTVVMGTKELRRLEAEGGQSARDVLQASETAAKIGRGDH